MRVHGTVGKDLAQRMQQWQAQSMLDPIGAGNQGWQTFCGALHPRETRAQGQQMFERDRSCAEIAVNGEAPWEELHHLLIKSRQVLLMQSNAEKGGDDAFSDGLDIDAVLGIASLVVALKDERAVA